MSLISFLVVLVNMLIISYSVSIVLDVSTIKVFVSFFLICILIVLSE